MRFLGAVARRESAKPHTFAFGKVSILAPLGITMGWKSAKHTLFQMEKCIVLHFRDAPRTTVFHQLKFLRECIGFSSLEVASEKWKVDARVFQVSRSDRDTERES